MFFPLGGFSVARRATYVAGRAMYVAGRATYVAGLATEITLKGSKKKP